jgi:hypothetical protein
LLTRQRYADSERINRERISLDNLDVAILSKINDLADSCEVKPYEFLGTLDRSKKVSGCGVIFTIPAETSPEQQRKVQDMIDALGADKSGVLGGGEIAVVNAIDNALQRRPIWRR